MSMAQQTVRSGDGTRLPRKTCTPGQRDVTLYKLAKFAERDGLAPQDILAEIYERANYVNAAYPSVERITESDIKRICRDYI